MPAQQAPGKCQLFLSHEHACAYHILLQLAFSLLFALCGILVRD